MQIKIRGAQQDHNLSVPNAESTWTVLELKQAIVRAHRGDNELTADGMRLIFAGRVMNDSQALSEFGIQDEQTVHMVVRPAASPDSAGAQQQQQQQQPQVGATIFGQQAGQANPLGDLFNQFVPALNQIMPALTQGLNRMVPPTAAAAAPVGPASEGSASQQPNTTAQAQTAAAQQAAQAAAAAQAAVAAQAAAQAHVQHMQAMQHQQILLHHHLHHHHQHHVHHQVQFRGPVPQPPSVQVHIHVNLAELDELPARLQTFYQRVAPAPVTVRIEQPAPAASGQTAAPPSSAAAPQGQTAPPAAQRPAPSSAAPPAPAPAPAPAAAATQPRPNLTQIVAAAGMPVETEPATNLFDALEREVMNSMEIADLMRLVNGDWSPIQKARPAVVAYINGELAADNSPGNRERLAAKTAKALVLHLVDHVELRPAFLMRQKPQQNIFRALENGLYATSLELIHLFLEEPCPSNFAQRLRLHLVRFVGSSIDHLSREMLINGQADVDVLVQALVRAGIQAAARQNAQIGAFAPMAGNMAMNALVMWRNEYMQLHRRAGDSAIFTTDPRVLPAAPPSTAPATAATAAAISGPPSVSIDDLLDEALGEQSSVPAPPTSDPAIANLRRALQDTSLAPEAVSSILEAAGEAASAPQAGPLDPVAKGLLPR